MTRTQRTSSKTTLALMLLSVLALGLSLGACSTTEEVRSYPAITQPQPDGEYCFKGADCKSGICEGEGCGPNQPGTCSPKYRICDDDDKRKYCICDGQTKILVSTCPDMRYRHARGCDD